MRTSHFAVSATVAVLIAASSAPNYATAAEPPIKAGDKVVVLRDTHMQAGTEKLAPVEAGTGLTATDVKDDWIAVTMEREGKRINGWLDRRNLTSDPAGTFTRLVGRSSSDAQNFKSIFTAIDKNKNSQLTLEEFVSGSRQQTLDDLNTLLVRALDAQKKQLADTGVPQSFFTQRMAITFVLYGVEVDGVSFNNWKRSPTSEEIDQLREDFLRTRDMRRSATAQQLVDREDPKVRAERAQALFKWADRNHDGKLSLEEFKQALGKKE